MNTKKKILFLVTQSEFGGAQRFIHTLVNNLGKDRYDIIVCAGTEGDDENGLLNLLDKQGVKTERSKYLKRSINPFFDLLGLFEIKNLLKKENPDILFLCSSKAGFIGSLAARLCRRNTQIESRQVGNTQINAEYQCESAYSEGDNPRVSAQLPKVIYRIGGWTFNDPWLKWKKKLYVWIEKISAKWKDYIVNNAESDSKQAIKLGINPKKEILVIYNGINVDEMDFLSREEAREIIFKSQFSIFNQVLNSNDIIVGTISHDYPAKGLKYLREAEGKMFDVRNVRFVILSGVPNAYKYLRAFDVFVLPSVKEGFPWVVLEAMTAELPIIATKVGVIPEVIQNNENGILIKPRSSEAIVEAIKKLLDNPSLREKLAKAGRKTVEEKFNLQIMLKQYEDLFSLN